MPTKMAAPNEFWLLTVPKEGQTPEATFEKLRRHTDGASQGYLIQVPSLTVGTLNSLMSLSELSVPTVNEGTCMR